MDGSLPVIDLSDLTAAAPGALERVAAAIGRAAREVGFFWVTGHGVSPAVSAAAFAASEAFFALPRAQKAALAIDRVGANRGYVGEGAESLDPSRPPDLKEAFNIGFDLPEGDPERFDAAGQRGVNAWPELAGFRPAVEAYFAAVLALGRRLHRAIALDLGADPEFFADKLDRPMATLRLLHYPPRPAAMAPGRLGAGAHTDYGNLTLLATDAVGGLEVRRRDGVWVAAPPMPGAFVVNIGDCLMRWSNDVYVSTPHRVVNPEGRERWSIAFFLDPNPEAVVTALPGCVAPGEAPRHPPITAAAHLAARLAATYGGA
ncbi:isopenicillin N synthase family oxygenase [Siculibacillus lacustris]|uniref:2-oxoglutarate-dependent ethylene/succinate-forming enzyme n=1 Tax=Siculibacillus lacustris TaxID=1549641 RepID=A0A4Q9VQU1_9HYPH|nr:2-oxoglutarate and iron-dependent oxygenase domain-containing protein [Siculibacillus lacustris]TBW37354.1 isopenicillin N synthase family oxygenase [Siculibacillus lacustris]